MENKKDLSRLPLIIKELFGIITDDNIQNMIIEWLSRRNDECMQEFKNIQEGKLISLHSDTMSKIIFNADSNLDRLQTLARKITKDYTLELESSLSNEKPMQIVSSKRIITDVPAKSRDGRTIILEFQNVAQKYYDKRTELYSAEGIISQYSVPNGMKKSDYDYSDVKGSVLIFLYVKSPTGLTELVNRKNINNYIHRSSDVEFDTGISLNPLQKVIFVQLDKCFKQFKEGKDAENDKDLQLILSAIYDINDKDVIEKSKDNPYMERIYRDIKSKSGSKEVLAMLLAEKYAELDYISDINDARRTEREKELCELYLEGLLDLCVCAKRLNISEDEFLRLCNKFE